MAIEEWPMVASNYVADYRIGKMRQDRRRSPRTGAEHDFYVMEMPSWVNIIPITPDNKVVLIRQYRHGTQGISLEIPGGLVDPGEAPLVAAKRELLEETGYCPAEVLPLGQVAPNPAIQDNTCHSFVALDTKRVGAQQLEGGEDISVEEVDLEAIPGMIAGGQINHSLVVVAFYWLEQFWRQREAMG